MRSGFMMVTLLLYSHAATAEIFVAVAPITIEEKNRNAPTGEMMQEMVKNCLSIEPSLAVVERADMNAITSEAGDSVAGFNRGKGLSMHLKGVQYVITGSMVLLDDKWLLNLQANDPVTAQMVVAHSALLNQNFYRENNTLCAAAVTPLAGRLIPMTGKPLDKTEEDTQSEESTLLLKGIGYSQNGDYARAFPYFLKILDRNPHHADARYWLAVSYEKAGLKAFAQKEAAEFLTQFPDHPKRKEMEQLLSPPSRHEDHL